jgi:hypothetical protein
MKTWFAATSVGLLAATTLVVARPSPGAAPPDACGAISPRSMEAYSRTIADAHKSAASDAARNGTSGAYAVAARNARDQLKQAQDWAAKAVTDLRSSDPSVTTPAEAGTIKEHLRYILQLVPQAAHWAIVSEIYHDSRDAARAFDGSVRVLAEGNVLFAEAGRCYMQL